MVDRSFRTILPLTRKVRLDPGELVRELRLFVEQSGASVRIDPRMMTQADQRPGGLRGLFSAAAPPERVLFEVDGVRLRVHAAGEPFEKRSRIHRFVNPAHWTSGLGEFADHRAHIVVQEAGIEGEEGPDAVFDRAAAVTATAAVVARLTGPVGVVWSTAENAIPLSLFRQSLDELTEGLAPLRLWVRWHMLPPDELQDAHPGLVTHGLAPFIGREVLARPSLVESQDLIAIVLAFARRLVDERVSVAERDRVTLEDGTDLDIRLRGPGKMSDAPVYELAVPGMDAPPPREPAPDPLAMPSMPGSPEQGEGARARRRPRRGGIGALFGLGQEDDDDGDRLLAYNIPPPPGRPGGGEAPAGGSGAGHPAPGMQGLGQAVPGQPDSASLAAAFAAPGGLHPAASGAPAVAGSGAPMPGATAGSPDRPDMVTAGHEPLPEGTDAARPAPTGAVPPAPPPPLDLTLWAKPMQDAPTAAAADLDADGGTGSDSGRAASGAPGAEDEHALPRDTAQAGAPHPAGQRPSPHGMAPPCAPYPAPSLTGGSDHAGTGTAGTQAQHGEPAPQTRAEATTPPRQGGRPRTDLADGVEAPHPPGTGEATDREGLEDPARDHRAGGAGTSPPTPPRAEPPDVMPDPSRMAPERAAPDATDPDAGSRVVGSARAEHAAAAGGSDAPAMLGDGPEADPGADGDAVVTAGPGRGAARTQADPAGAGGVVPPAPSDRPGADSPPAAGDGAAGAGDRDALRAGATGQGDGSATGTTEDGAPGPDARDPGTASGSGEPETRVQEADGDAPARVENGPHWLFPEAHRTRRTQAVAPDTPWGVQDAAPPADDTAAAEDAAPDRPAGAAAAGDGASAVHAPGDAHDDREDTAAGPADAGGGPDTRDGAGEPGARASCGEEAPGPAQRAAGAASESHPPEDPGHGDAAPARPSWTAADGQIGSDTELEDTESEYVVIGGRRIRVISGGRTGT